MYCSKCGEKLSNANQNFCHNCGAEVPNHYKPTNYKTPSYKPESPQIESSPQVYYVPVKYPRQLELEKGLPGKNSKLCLGMAISSIFLGIASLMIGYYSNMFFYYPYENITRLIGILVMNIFFRIGGLILGIFSKYNSSKAVTSEPYNEFEKAGSIIGILGIIINAIGVFLLFFGPYSLMYIIPRMYYM